MIKELEDPPLVFRELLTDVGNRRRNLRKTRREKNRISAVVSAFDAKDVLPKTLKEITQLIRGSGLGGEIFVVLNNGGGNTMESLSPSSEAEIGVDNIIWGRTEQMKAKREKEGATPRKIKLGTGLSPMTKGISLVLIKQDKDPDNAGKIRGLRDVYELLWELNQKSGYCPQYLFAFDAETRLHYRGPRQGHISTQQNFGLNHMIKLTNKGRVVVGAKCKLIPYNVEGNPDWEAETPPMQVVTNMLHGRDGYRWLSGGATLGDFGFMVAAMSAISRKFPGLRVEDTMLTAVAKAMNIGMIVDPEVIHTNRCPSMENRVDASRQVERWMMGVEGVKRVIGKSFSKKIVNDNLTKAFALVFFELVKGGWKETAYLLQGILPYIETRRRSKLSPDDLINGPAIFG